MLCWAVDFLGFEVFTAVVMNSIIFWDMASCSPSSVNPRFGVTYCLNLQGRKNHFSKDQELDDTPQYSYPQLESCF
jgi:hypothetical protein